MTETEMGVPSLRELSEAATQGEWSLGEIKGGYRYLNASGGKSSVGFDRNVPWTGFARFVVEMEEGESCAGAANVGLAVALVNAFRANRLHTNEALAQAVAAARAEGWQDIATAPREYQPILLLLRQGKYGDVKHAPVVGVWNPDLSRWSPWQDMGRPTDADPTHWMPLPAPPTTPGGRTDG